MESKKNIVQFTDCTLKGVKFYDVDEVEIIISPLPTMIWKRIITFLFGMKRKFTTSEKWTH